MKYLLLLAFVLIGTLVISQFFDSKSTPKNARNSGVKSETSKSESTPTIQYETLSSKDGFEIRKYPKLTVASTVLSSNTYSSNSSSGFRKIASYIFGGNSDNTQIEMTSPVQMDMGSEPKMSFFMPDDMNIDDLPVPNREDVTIHVQNSKIVAVIQFSGWASDKVLENKFNALKTKLKADSIEFENSYSYLGYNAPFDLVNRRNEVIIPLINFE